MAKLDFAKGVTAVLTGTTNWAQLTEKSGPNKMSGKYQVELTLDQESINVLEGMKIMTHLNIKRQDGTLKYEKPTVRLKTNNPPTLWDTSKQVFNDFIGNGSTLRAKVFIKSWEMAGKKGLTAYINKGLLLSLNDVEGADDDDLWDGVKVTTPQMPDDGAVTVADATADAAFGNTSAPAATEDDDSDLPF
jgi:hypothetical protein